MVENRLSDAVQPDAWYKDLPRKQYGTLEPVEQPEAWFSVYRLPGDIYAIYEPGHFQEVISFLVMGQKSALLIDTGMGIGNIKNVTDALCALPLAVVNTHSHFDHIGGNHRYGLVYILDHPAAVRRIQAGLPAGEVADNMREGSNAVDYPAGFSPESYHIEPCGYEAIQPGHIFDLGGRQLEVVATPGHSPDSIMLADRASKLLFTGDTIYPATLYAHLDLPGGMRSAADVYQATVAGLAAQFSDYTLICSHNEPLRPGSMLHSVAEAFASIQKGDAPYQADSAGLKKYTFQDFCIVTQ